jgi:N-acetyl-beta-hexosaminidase
MIFLPKQARDKHRESTQKKTVFVAAYSEQQLRHIVGYAAERGVRVMVEFDLPGHIAGPICSTEPR